jgi:hypothetical protein
MSSDISNLQDSQARSTVNFFYTFEECFKIFFDLETHNLTLVLKINSSK